MKIVRQILLIIIGVLAYNKCSNKIKVDHIKKGY